MKIISGSPESFGWQRRPDMDTQFKGTPFGIAYEKPDGSLYLFPPGKKPEVVRWINAEDSRGGRSPDQEKGTLDFKRVRDSYKRAAEEWLAKKGHNMPTKKGVARGAMSQAQRWKTAP